MNLSELIPFLKQLDARPKKHLSQNFLIDPNIVRKIVQTADVKPGDTVLEIGPGPGALTAALLETGAQVVAVEKDPLFARELPRFQTKDQRLSVYEADFLEFPLDRFSFPLKVVANLPYHITTPILEKIFAASSLFSSLTIMIQKEVADRIGAQSGSKDFSSLTLFVEFYSRIHSSFKVAANCFYPRPKVDSTVIRLDFQPLPSVEPTLFFPLVRRAFQQRRKMISTSLQTLFSSDEIKQSLIEIRANPDIRPEGLPLGKWIELFQLLNQIQSRKNLTSDI